MAQSKYLHDSLALNYFPLPSNILMACMTFNENINIILNNIIKLTLNFLEDINLLARQPWNKFHEANARTYF